MDGLIDGMIGQYKNRQNHRWSSTIKQIWMDGWMDGTINRNIEW